AGGARCSHALGPVATAGRPVASEENTTSPSCGTDRIASLWAVVQYGRQRPWPMVHRPEQSPLTGAFQCILQIARSPLLVRSLLAQLLEPPRYGPVCQVVWEGRSREAPPLSQSLTHSRPQPSQNPALQHAQNALQNG